jgi:hypothetical protein
VLDAAIYLRSIYQQDAYITAIFTLPSVIDRKLQSALQRQRIRANTYAALKELDYIMSSGRSLEVKYPGEVSKTVERPFDRIYLIEGFDQHNNAVPDDKHLYDMIAQQMFIEIATPINDSLRQKEVNVSDEYHPETNRLLC